MAGSRCFQLGREGPSRQGEVPMSPRLKPGVVLFLLFFSPSLSRFLGAAELTAPSALTATAVSSNRINLAWLDGNNGMHSFRIERRLAASAWVEIGTTSKDAPNYPDISLQPFT